VSLPVSPIAATAAKIAAAELADRARTSPERRRRHLVRLIDRVIGQCERANLAADIGGTASVYNRPVTPAPPAAVALVAWLQLEAGEVSRPPTTAVEALDELFRLQRRYLAHPAECGDVGDLVWSVAR